MSEPTANSRTQRDEILAEMRRRMYDRDPYVDRRDFPGIVNPTPRVAELRLH